MSFRDCIITSGETGRISQKKVAEALDAFDAEKADGLAQGLSDSVAEQLAIKKFVDAITKLKADKRWARVNEMRKAKVLWDQVQGSEAPWRVLEDTANSLGTKQKRIAGQAMTNLDSFILAYKPKWGGIVHPVEKLDNIADELYGEASGDRWAKGVALAIQDTFEWLRQRANAEGASIPENKNRKAPQTHDRIKLMRYSDREWVEDHLGRLDFDTMEWHGKPFPTDPDKRREILTDVYWNIRSEGNISKKPAQGSGENLATRLAHDRFLYYKDATSYKEMSAKYGSGNLHQQVIGMIDMMAKDIAVLETLGPNPNVMGNFFKNAAKKRAADLERAGLYKEKMSAFKKMEEASLLYDDLYDIHNHAIVGAEENRAAQAFASLRTVSISSKLGSAFLPNLTDIFAGKWTSLFYGLPQTGLIRDYIKHFATGRISAEDAIADGIMFESGLSAAHSHVRYEGPLDGPHWARMFSDIIYRSTLLTHLTQTGKIAHGMRVQRYFAKNRDVEFFDLTARPELEKLGVTEKDWDAFRKTPVFDRRGAPFLRPIDMWKGATTAEERRIADKFTDYMTLVMNDAVPTADLRVRRAMGENTSPATFGGMMLKNTLSLMTFPTTMYFNQWRKIARTPGTGNKAKLAAWLFLYMTGAGAFVTQLKALGNGQNPHDMTDPEFWGRAVINGGSLGLLGDFVFDNIALFNGSSSGDTPLEADVKKWAAAVTDPSLKNSLQAVDTIIPKPWFAKVIYQRAIYDELLKQADPAAYRRYVNRLNKYEEGRWWGPGESPELPDLSTTIGE